MKTTAQLFMIALLTSVITFLNSKPLHADTIYVGGAIDTDMVWEAEYVIAVGDVWIEEGATLVVMPGTNIEFRGHYGINIEGSLLAVGTADSTIVFTVSENHKSVGWRGLRFYNAAPVNDASLLMYCEFEHAKAIGSFPDNCGGALYAYATSKLDVEYCYFHNNEAYDGGAIFIDGANVNLRHNVISHNQASYGGGVSLYKNAESKLENNTITDNTARVDGGGIFCFAKSDPLLQNNQIKRNSAGHKGGGLAIVKSDPDMLNNIICCNEAQYGGGIEIENAEPTIINNSIYKNIADNGGAVSCHNASPLFMNTILSLNVAKNFGHQVFLDDDGSQPVFDHCLVQDGIEGFVLLSGKYHERNYTNNIEGMANFVLEGEAKFALQPNSDCINAGRAETDIRDFPQDIEGKARIIDGMIDIGAYEYNSTLTSMNK